MEPNQSSIIQLYRYILLLLLASIVLSACDSLRPQTHQFTPKEEFVPAESAEALQSSTSEVGSDSPRLRTLFIQNLSGQKLPLFRQIFFNTLEREGGFRIKEILPDSYRNLGVLRIHVEDIAIWENEEMAPIGEGGVLSTEQTANIIMRRNALVSAKVALFDGATGKEIIRSIFSQPFQQIYTSPQSIASRPTKQQEIQRLLRLLSLKITYAFESRGLDTRQELEEGLGYGWIVENFLDIGDRRLLKGNAFAEVGDLEQAMWVWKTVLFSPGEGEPPEVYRINRAAALYNLGVMYHQQKDYWFAAKMFAEANRLQQKLKYAQAWGDDIHNWLQFKKNPPPSDEELRAQEKKKRRLKRLKEKDLLGAEKPMLIQNLEKNDNLLLKARELWPLEPLLKSDLPPDVPLADLKREQKADQQTDSEKERPASTNQLIRPVPLEPLKTKN